MDLIALFIGRVLEQGEEVDRGQPCRWQDHSRASCFSRPCVHMPLQPAFVPCPHRHHPAPTRDYLARRACPPETASARPACCHPRRASGGAEIDAPNLRTSGGARCRLAGKGSAPEPTFTSRGAYVDRGQRLRRGFPPRRFVTGQGQRPCQPPRGNRTFRRRNHRARQPRA